MMRKIFIVCITMVFGIMLTGCHTEHEWQEADCTHPSTCIECGETQGEVLGHTWKEADCTRPQTCVTCGETQGEALGHIWQEADCTLPGICVRCGEMRGEALGHTWQEADYFTPQICLTCGSEQGEPLQPSFEAHGLAANVRVGETYDYVTTCSADVTKTTVGKVTFSNYRIFEDTLLEGYEWRAVHMEIAFSDENAQNYGMKLGYAHEDYYDTETWDASYDEKGGNARLYTIRYGGVDYTECKSIFSDSGYSGWVDGVNTLKCEVFAVVPAGYDGMVICLRNGGTERKAGESIYNVVDEDTLFLRLGDEDATVLPTVGGSDTGAADADAASKEEKGDARARAEALVQTLGERISWDIKDKLFDDNSLLLSYYEDKAAFIIRVAAPEYIPNVATCLCDIIMEAVEESDFSRGTININYYDTKSDGSKDADSAESWFTEDGVTGEFSSAPDNIRIEDCTIQQLYDHYADRLGLMDTEQTLAAMRELLNQNCQVLLHEDEDSLLVFEDRGKIVIYARTYEAYLIPLLAERTVEAVYELVKKSALPLGDIYVYCVDEGEDGSKDTATMTFWRTTDMETGTFSSAPDAVYEELYTIEDMYEYYEEYFDLIERAMNGERIDAE